MHVGLHTAVAMAALLGLACGSGRLDETDGDADADSDADADAGDECGGCTTPLVCRDGRCVEPDALCAAMGCPEGSTCYLGVCRPANPCDGVECPNPGDVCQGGRCVAGGADSDNDGVVARDDCDDSDPLVNPDAEERCDDVCVTCTDGAWTSGC